MARMRATAKYLFDDDFARAGDAKPAVALAEHAAKVKEAEAAAFNRGFAAGTAEAKAAAETRAAAALERIASALDGLNKGLSGIAAGLESESVAVAVAVARKLAPELVAREPFAEIEALAAGCFQHLVATPQVMVRVNAALQQTARERLAEIARACGLDSRLVVLAEPGIAPGDCRIEWADGGINRDSAATEAAIDAAVRRYLGARRAGDAMNDTAWRFDR
jgi:flagellar assembly protein FliH